MSSTDKRCLHCQLGSLLDKQDWWEAASGTQQISALLESVTDLVSVAPPAMRPELLDAIEQIVRERRVAILAGTYKKTDGAAVKTH